MTAEDHDLRCSIVTRSLGEPATGTATSADRFVLVELPAPWPKPITGHPLLREVMSAQPDPPTGRILAIGNSDGPLEEMTVISYVKDRTSGGFTGTESRVASEQLTTTVLSALDGDPLETTVGDDVVDLLICTQGVHDRCCGRFGTLLYADTHDRFAPAVRVWRTSHTGGHRFAPTGITFPDGINWAGLDPTVLDSVVARDVSPSAMSQHLRGRSGVSHPAAQIVDSLALGRFGWPWLTATDLVVDVETEDETLSVTMTATVSDVGPIVVNARLSEGSAIPVPPCGMQLELSKKSAKQFVIDSFESVPAG